MSRPDPTRSQAARLQCPHDANPLGHGWWCADIHETNARLLQEDNDRLERVARSQLRAAWWTTASAVVFGLLFVYLACPF